jgi:RNA polymerase sigma-70 factor (ECF subfamily)
MDLKPDFQDIYDDYYPKLVRYLTGLVGEADAEDLTQEAMVKINNGLDQFRGESALSTWIYRIATNVARDRFRSAAYKADSVTDGADDEEFSARLDSSAPPPRDLENTTVRKEMNTWIRGFIDGLPEEYREPLILKDIEGLTNSEIAEVLGISLDNTKIRLHRARAALKNLLEQGCDFHRDQENEFGCEPKDSRK